MTTWRSGSSIVVIRTALPGRVLVQPAPTRPHAEELASQIAPTARERAVQVDSLAIWDNEDTLALL